MPAGSRIGMGEVNLRDAAGRVLRPRTGAGEPSHGSLQPNDPRTAARMRAQELKRSLPLVTIRLPRSPVAEGRRPAVTRRRGVFWPVITALLIGALSMLIPLPNTSSLRGQVQARAADEQAPHAFAYAPSAECSGLGWDAPGSAVVDAPGFEGSVLTAQVLQLTPHAAQSGKRGCRIELALQADPDDAEVLGRLPPGAALRVALPAQPRSWFAALLDQLPREARVAELSTFLREQAAHARGHLAHLK